MNSRPLLATFSAALFVLAAALLPFSALRAQMGPTSQPDNKRIIPYRIIVNDQLGIHIFQEDDLGISTRVDSRGNISLNLVGPVHVYGMTIQEAEKAIQEAYHDGKYLVHPQVTISLDGLAPREVSVGGYVKNPGRIVLPVETATTLIDIIAKAGGFADTAKGSGVKLTRIHPDGTNTVYEIDVEDVIRGKEKDTKKIQQANMVLEPGDVIYVPERII